MTTRPIAYSVISSRSREVCIPYVYLVYATVLRGRCVYARVYPLHTYMISIPRDLRPARHMSMYPLALQPSGRNTLDHIHSLIACWAFDNKLDSQVDQGYTLSN